MTFKCPSVHHWAQDFTHRTTTVRGIEMDEPPPVTTTRDPRAWLYEADAAEVLGLTCRGLRARRERGNGPAHHQRVGGVAYYEEELRSWAAGLGSLAGLNGNPPRASVGRRQADSL